MNYTGKAKPVRLLFDGVYLGVYVKAWYEGKGRDREVVVQVWNSGKPEGIPDGDWGMPAILGVGACIAQAVAQTD